MCGFESYKAIKKDLLLTAFLGFSLVITITAVANAARIMYDSTDDSLAGERSGLRLHTDNLTGCQYLSAPSAGLTPRLNRDGKQLCGGEQ